MNKISLCLLFASIFSIQSADSVKRPKITTHATAGWPEQDIAVKHLKKKYAERFNCAKDEVEIIKSEKDASGRKSLQDDPIIKDDCISSRCFQSLNPR